MALMDCPECRTEVSEHAPSCPNCAYPLGKRVPSPLRSTTAPRPVLNSPLDATKSIVGRLALGVFLFGGAASGSEVMVAFGAAIVAVSSIPVWFRAKRAERLGLDNPGNMQKLESRLERQLQEGEERALQQAAEIEENARQIAELEERLDFTERLLTRQREEA